MFIPIAIHKSEASVYGVTVPDIPGCHSWGNTVGHAIENAKKAIISHMVTIVELGEQASVSVTDVSDLHDKEEFADAMWAFVEVDLEKFDTTPEWVNVSLPRYVLSKIDARTKSTRETRSGFLAKAAMHKLDREELETI